MKKVKFDLKNFEPNAKALKTLGILGTFIGIGASLLSGYVSDKQLDLKVDEKVSEALAKMSK